MTTAARLFTAVVTTAILGGCAAGRTYDGGASRNDDLFNRIQPGMATGEVQQMIGRADRTMGFPLSHTTAWIYDYYDAWGYMAEFSVTFDAQGRAVSKLSRRVNVGGDHSPR